MAKTLKLKPKLLPGYWKETVTHTFRVKGVTLKITVTGYCTAGATHDS